MISPSGTDVPDDGSSHFIVRKIISGGQTGVDRAALDVALALGVACGGWVPKGRRAEDGPIDPRYPVTEMRQADYEARTLKNVEQSDGTLILTRGEPAGGTRIALDHAAKSNKHYHIVDLRRGHSPLAALRWLEARRPETLNVAGPRESEAPGIYDEAASYLNNLLSLARVSSSDTTPPELS